MSGERDWVETVKRALEGVLRRKAITVVTGYRLPYAVHVDRYKTKSSELAVRERVTTSYGYQTDPLIAYSAKAATHKNVHPYLRYGIVIGGYQGQVPRRLIRHGDHFDFMVTLASQKLTGLDRDRLVKLLREELRASRLISALLREKSDIWLLHRRLEVRSYRLRHS
jgi:hypothetical protein